MSPETRLDQALGLSLLLRQGGVGSLLGGAGEVEDPAFRSLHQTTARRGLLLLAVALQEMLARASI